MFEEFIESNVTIGLYSHYDVEKACNGTNIETKQLNMLQKMFSVTQKLDNGDPGSVEEDDEDGPNYDKRKINITRSKDSFMEENVRSSKDPIMTSHSSLSAHSVRSSTQKHGR